MLRRLPTVVIALGVVAAGAACSDDPAPTAEEPLPTFPVTTPTSIDITNVPDVIDLPYVGNVLRAIDHVHGEAARRVYEINQVDDEVIGILASIYSSTAGEDVVANFRSSVAEGLDQFYDGLPADRVTQVKSVLSTSSTCVVAATNTDVSPQYQRARRPLAGAVTQLALKRPESDPDHINPTPWVIGFSGVPDAGQDLNATCRG